MKGVYQNDPELSDLKEYFETGKLVDFPDHRYPSGIETQSLVQEIFEGWDAAF